MPLTTLDPSTALIVIDLQQGHAAVSAAHPFCDIVARSAELAEAFRRADLPVALVVVAGAPPGRTERGTRSGRVLPDGYADLVPELNQQAADHIVTKRARSAFTDTGLCVHLRHLGVTQVVITGISTSGGVESTARDAHEHGFNVTLAVDAMTDTRPDAHEHSITQVFPRIGETGTTEEIIGLLERTRV